MAVVATTAGPTGGRDAQQIGSQAALQSASLAASQSPLQSPAVAADTIEIAIKGAPLQGISPRIKSQLEGQIARTEELLKSLSGNERLLSGKEFKAWEGHLRGSGHELKQLLQKGQFPAFLKKLSQLNAELEELKSYFEYERSQGMVGIHAASGARIYQRGEATWLVSPDAKSFSDLNDDRLKEFVTGENLTVDSDAANFQTAKVENGAAMLGCRIDQLILDEGKDRFVASTHIRNKSGFTRHDLRFTRQDLANGRIPGAEYSVTGSWPEIRFIPKPYEEGPAVLAEIAETTPTQQRSPDSLTDHLNELARNTAAVAVKLPINPGRNGANLRTVTEPAASAIGRHGRAFVEWAKNKYVRGSGATGAQPEGAPAARTGGALRTLNGQKFSYTVVTPGVDGQPGMRQSFTGEIVIENGREAFKPLHVGDPVPDQPADPFAQADKARRASPKEAFLEFKGPDGKTEIIKIDQSPRNAIVADSSPGGQGAVQPRLGSSASPSENLQVKNPPIDAKSPQSGTGVESKAAKSELAAETMKNAADTTKASGSGSITQRAPTSMITADAVKSAGKFAWLRGRTDQLLERAGKVSRDPRAQNTAYLVGLVGFHHAMAGDYRPDAKHSVLPRVLTALISDKHTDDHLFYRTSDTAVAAAWLGDTVNSAADAGLVLGGAKGVGKSAHILLNSGRLGGFLEKYAVTRGLQKLPNGTLRWGGKLLGAVYAPAAGLSYTMDGRFVENDKSDWKMAGSPIEGAIAGGMIGGPYAPVTAAVGATVSTAASIYGAFTVIGDRLEQHKTSAQEQGVRHTLERAAQGWVKADGKWNPNEPIPEYADTYITRLAESDFIHRLIRAKEQDGYTFPFYSNDWETNWENLEDFLEEVRDYRNGEDYWFGSPLDDYSEAEKKAALEVYKYVFEREDGTLNSCRRDYRRAYKVEIVDTTETGAWDTFWGKDKEEGSKRQTFDELRDLAKDFEGKFRSEEAKLKSLDPESSAAQKLRDTLIKEEAAFLTERFPNLRVLLANERDFNIIESRTAPHVGGVTGSSFLTNSTAVQAWVRHLDAVEQQMELELAAQNPEFQETILASLADEAAAGGVSPRERMRQHFSGEKPMSDEELNGYYAALYDHFLAADGE